MTLLLSPLLHVRRFLSCLCFTSLIVALVACSGKTNLVSNGNTDVELSPRSILAETVQLDVGNPMFIDVEVQALTQRLSLDMVLDRPYASLSVFSGERRLVDNMNIPHKGRNSLNALLEFEKPGKKRLKFIVRSAPITLESVQLTAQRDMRAAKFIDISKQTGFVTEETYKYGGPAIADVDNDGDYDFALNNHNFIPTQLVLNDAGKRVTVTKLFPGPMDYHGSAFGDYDRDGDLDLMVAFGGGNGTSPTSYALMKNDNGKLHNVAEKVGITVPTRGRSPRWIDLDLDGDLDVALINAQIPNYDGPRQLFFRNKGDGTFEQTNIEGLEYAGGDRILLNDFNKDGKADILLYSPLSLWRNDGDFKFTDVSKEQFPQSLLAMQNIVGAADMDVNNDGLNDIYLARGKPAYQISRKSIDFNPETKRLDIRDDGEKGTTAINFSADDVIRLSNMELTFRQYRGGFAIFLGKDKVRKIVKSKGFQVNQLPEEMKTAADFMDINRMDAQGWPEVRDVNGLYIGHMNNGKWRAEWVRDGNIYWQVTFSLTGLNDIDYDWTPNNRNVKDVLLVHDGERFIDKSKEWNIPTGGNHVGVTYGDFNNDGWNDLMVYRYGFLKARVNDLVLMNTGKGQFEIVTEHGARDENDPGHGDMGQAFDFDLDGRVDVLNGSEEEGHWYLYKNTTPNTGNYVLVNVGYSPEHNVDSYSAYVNVTTQSGKRYTKRVGSAGAIHAQSQLNIVHFGLGDDKKIKNIDVVWRNGETLSFKNIVANKIYATAKSK